MNMMIKLTKDKDEEMKDTKKLFQTTQEKEK